MSKTPRHTWYIARAGNLRRPIEDGGTASEDGLVATLQIAGRVNHDCVGELIAQALTVSGVRDGQNAGSPA